MNRLSKVIRRGFIRIKKISPAFQDQNLDIGTLTYILYYIRMVQFLKSLYLVSFEPSKQPFEYEKDYYSSNQF